MRPAVPFPHQPAMVSEVVELFATVPDGTVVDATVGGGGHAEALLGAHPGLAVLGLDQDPEAVAAAAARLDPYGSRAQVEHARFDRLAAVAAGHADPVVGVLFDLGVSSPQLDRPERGFSYRADGPLDMRMDPGAARSAHEIVNGATEAELARVLRTFGEERFAARIARAIVTARPIGSTGRLAEVVAGAVPAPARRHGGHPARRSFQAIRIAVNEELAVLVPALDQALDLLAPAGRCVVIAYHSGEDRIVKQRFRQAATGGCICPRGLPCVCGATPAVRLLTRRPQRPTEAEVAGNRRAGSARLRAVERLADGSPGRP
ncbi:MAG: 16S rRNA (cytosine(1402)-N(4))-methyltransferase RsmH [Acidimicrobiales bacterium]